MRSPSTDSQFSNSNKVKIVRWFKNVINIFRSKFKGASKRYNRFEREDSSTEISADSLSEENITFDSAVDVLAQYSLTSTSSLHRPVVQKGFSNKTRTRENWNRSSTSSCFRPNLSPFFRSHIYQDSPSIRKENHAASESPVQSNCMRQILPDYGFNFNSSRTTQRFFKEPQRRKQFHSKSANFEFNSSFRLDSESNSRKNISDEGDFLKSEEKSDLWSLHYGEVSPKKLEDSLECIQEELYAPLKYVRMEHGDKLEQKETNFGRKEKNQNLKKRQKRRTL